MANVGDRAGRATRWLRRVARVWSIVVIGVTLLVVVAHLVFPEPGTADYPPAENLLPLAMCLSVVGLGVAWRWEGLGGAVNVGFFLVNLALYWVLRGRFLPLRAVGILSLAAIPGVLFLVCWWRMRSDLSRKAAH